MQNTAVRATAKDTPAGARDIGDAIDLLCRAISLNELMFMAAHDIELHGKREAMSTGADVINGMLEEAKAILYANAEMPARGRAKS